MSSMIVPKGKTRRAVFIVAGEASGDLHGAGLVREMKKLDPTLTFSGVGGKRMEAEGVRLVARSAEMAVVGITEVFTKIRFILGIFFRMNSLVADEHHLDTREHEERTEQIKRPRELLDNGRTYREDRKSVG